MNNWLFDINILIDDVSIPCTWKATILIDGTISIINYKIRSNSFQYCFPQRIDKGNDYVNVIFRFDCRVTGRPYPEVTWYINGQQVANDLTHKILVNESGNNSLMITNVSRADAGVVTCVARNKAGETSFQCNLNVIEKEQVVAPKFVERFTTTNVKEGEPVVFMARAVGTPVPRITWQKVWWKFYEIKLRIIDIYYHVNY